MYSLIAFRKFMEIFGRAGQVSVNALEKEMGCSRSTANRYMKAMMDALLVKRIGHGKYVLMAYTSVLDGYARAVNPMEYYAFRTNGSVGVFTRKEEFTEGAGD